MNEYKFDKKSKPTKGRMTGSSTATDWAAPAGTPIPEESEGKVVMSGNWLSYLRKVMSKR